jgi:uncharacterized membrane protein YwaF
VGAVDGVGFEKIELVDVPDCLFIKSPATYNGAHSNQRVKVYFMMIWAWFHGHTRIQHRSHRSRQLMALLLGLCLLFIGSTYIAGSPMQSLLQSWHFIASDCVNVHD